MSQEIKQLFSSSTALTINLGALASSTAGVGVQSDMVDNSTDRFGRIFLYVKVKLGTSPTTGKSVYVYLLKGDKNGTAHRTDNASATAGALTILNAQLIGVIAIKASPTTGDIVYGELVIENPGPEWGVCIVHDTVAALDASSHYVRFVGADPEIQ